MKFVDLADNTITITITIKANYIIFANVILRNFITGLLYTCPYRSIYTDKHVLVAGSQGTIPASQRPEQQAFPVGAFWTGSQHASPTARQVAGAAWQIPAVQLNPYLQ